jgi:hypothetical protein
MEISAPTPISKDIAMVEQEKDHPCGMIGVHRKQPSGRRLLEVCTSSVV